MIHINKKPVETLPAFESSPAAADVEVQEQGGNPMSGNSPSTDFSIGEISETQGKNKIVLRTIKIEGAFYRVKPL